MLSWKRGHVNFIFILFLLLRDLQLHSQLLFITITLIFHSEHFVEKLSTTYFGFYIVIRFIKDIYTEIVYLGLLGNWVCVSIYQICWCQTHVDHFIICKKCQCIILCICLSPWLTIREVITGHLSHLCSFIIQFTGPFWLVTIYLSFVYVDLFFCPWSIRVFLVFSSSLQQKVSSIHLFFQLIVYGITFEV